MDPVTHTLVGVGIANAVFRRRAGPAAVPILALASNLPDLDGIVHLTGDPYAVLMRRTFGHSIFLLPLWSIGLAWLLRRRYRHLGFGTIFGMTLLGAGVHLFFDLINSFGVVLLWPFSRARPELAWVFIIDFVLTGLLALPLLAAIARPLRGALRPMSQAALLAIAAYLGVCGVAHARAMTLLERQTAADFAYVFPEPLGAHRWRGVVRRGGVWDISLIRPFAGTVEPRGQVRTELADPAVTAARRTPDGRRLDWFFKAPVWERQGDAVTAWDLRFRPLSLDRPAVFRFTLRPPALDPGPSNP